MGNKIDIISKPVIMSDDLIEEKCIYDIARVKDLNLSELRKLINIDGLEKSLVYSLELEKYDLLNVGNLWRFTYLTKLQIANNFIEEIENLELLSNLQFLDLSFNSIKCIKGLDSQTCLTYLNLSSNKIEVLENMESLKKLETFLIRYNKIKLFDNIYYLRQFECLLHLGIAGNPFVEESDKRLKIIALLPQLKLLDFISVSSDELQTAFEKYPVTVDKTENKNFHQSYSASSFLLDENFVERLSNGYGFEILLESDSNFCLLHSFPPASKIAENHRKKLTKLFDEWYKVSCDHCWQMQEEKKEFIKLVKEAEVFAHNITEKEEEQFINFKENMIKEYCYKQHYISFDQKNKEVKYLLEKWEKTLLKTNRNLMNACCLSTDLIHKRCKAFKKKMAKIQSIYIKNIEQICCEVIGVDETCINELMAFYENMFTVNSNSDITVINEDNESVELDPILMQLLKKKEYIEASLQLAWKVHSTVLQEKVNNLKISIDKFINEAVDSIVKEKIFVKRNEQIRNAIIFCNKQKYILETFLIL